MSDVTCINMPVRLLESLFAEISSRHPRKSFGYFISDVDPWTATDFVLFDDNIRNDRAWRLDFESYGDYFIEHGDAGFVATPEEAWRRQKEIWDRNMFEIGVFHSHQRHPANFSRIDYEMHVQRFDNLFHVIVSMRNPSLPVVRVFAPTRQGVRELDMKLTDRAANVAGDPLDVDTGLEGSRCADGTLATESRVSARPSDAVSVLAAIDQVGRLGDEESAERIFGKGVLRGSAERFEEHVASHMRRLERCKFEMGTEPDAVGHFCGESPRHSVALSTFEICEVAVTNELYSLFDASRSGVVAAGDLQKPVTSVSWAEAALFAMWMGCRLPTEAEWEYACGAGSPHEWCCDNESDLGDYAWYCKNSGGEVHRAATRAPNALGLFDLHGNVWEWCADTYDATFYRHCRDIDPVCVTFATPSPFVDKVTRGGCMHALPEMCRNRYRFHEPIGFRASDLGFRLARSASNGRNGEER